MSLDDVFGPRPGRPQHPDFAHLSEIVLQQDGWAVEDLSKRPDAFEEYIGRAIDPVSLTYMGTQRALRALAEAGVDPSVNRRLFVELSTFYVDAFMVGWRYRERYPPEDKPEEKPEAE